MSATDETPADSSLDVLGANLTRVTLPRGRIVWYSYSAPIALQYAPTECVITSDADWSTTTRKHRGRIEREHATGAGSLRVSPREFALSLASI